MATHETHGVFYDILAVANPELKPVCETLRQLISSLHKGFVEIVWPNQSIASFGIGPRKMTEHYAYIAVHRSHVNLGFYHGASMADPEGILEGSGKKLRHVKIHDLAAAQLPTIAALLSQAIEDRLRCLP